MPSDFHNRRPPQRRKTLADLLRELQARPGAARPAHSTSPVAGPGRIRARQNAAERNRETELERRQRLADDALRQLKGR